MIVYETREHFVMTEQDAHARLAGDFARAWRLDLVPDARRWDDARIAVAEHDRSWRTLDKTPLWNDAERRPYSFLDLPDELKWPHYQVGLDGFERVAPPFATLLCSLHYRSFAQNIHQESARAFSESERLRQERLLRALVPDGDGPNGGSDASGASIGEKPGPPLGAEGSAESEGSAGLLSAAGAIPCLQALQFCDRLSLYVCLNEPGVPKSSEFPWYRDGIAHSESLPFANGAPVVPSWVNSREIRLSRSPFPPSFEVGVAVKEVRKSDIAARGIRAAYEDAPSVSRVFRFLT